MINEQKIERMYDLAAQVVAKSRIIDTHFSEHAYWPQEMVAVLTEGRLRGQLFGAWMPITKEAYKDQEIRSVIVSRALDVWRGLAMSALVPMTLLKGPKGKLPT